MITIQQYFGKFFDHTDANEARKLNAANLLVACANLEAMAKADGIAFPDNPATKSGVSGTQYGGFRPQDCPEGAPHSSHKEGLAVDRYDLDGHIDAWCMLNSGIEGKLEQCGIYIEHPAKTEHWSHWTIKPPGSGNRVFYP